MSHSFFSWSAAKHGRVLVYGYLNYRVLYQWSLCQQPNGLYLFTCKLQISPSFISLSVLHDNHHSLSPHTRHTQVGCLHTKHHFHFRSFCCMPNGSALCVLCSFKFNARALICIAYTHADKWATQSI